MHIFYNAGVKITDMVGDIPGVGELWYHSEGIENIRSMALIYKDDQVTYDSRLDNTFRVWNEENKSTEHSGNLRMAYITQIWAIRKSSDTGNSEGKQINVSI